MYLRGIETIWQLGTLSNVLSVPNVPKRNRDHIVTTGFDGRRLVPNVPKRNRDGRGHRHATPVPHVPNVPKRNRD